MTLTIVYNTNTGFVNQSFDWLHKIISPNTYSCSLCQLTHSHFGAKEAWDNFINKQDFDVTFYHKNEFINRFPNSHLTFPWIGMRNKNNSFETLLDSENLHQNTSLENLLLILNQKLNQLIV